MANRDKIDAYFLSLKPDTPKRGYWDQGFIEDYLSGRLWKTPGWTGFNIKEVDRLPKAKKAIVVLPARHHADIPSQVNKELNRIKQVVLFLTGDEEADFPVDAISHPSISIWVQNPHPGKHDNYHKLGTGYPPQIRQVDGKPLPDKTTDIFFSGQITHERREQLRHHMPSLPLRVDFNGTEGFTQGYSHAEYYERMAKAKIAPAPSGAVIVDSFRLFEALELMCIPIADEVSPKGDMFGYWDWLFDRAVPFAMIRDWNSLAGYCSDLLNVWPVLPQIITAWWINYKRDFAYQVKEQLEDL